MNRGENVPLKKLSELVNRIGSQNDESQDLELGTNHELDEFEHFRKMVEEGRGPLAAVMAFMAADSSFRALSVICQGNNWRRIAFALGMVFHTNKNVPLRVQIARGHDSLRNLVTSCVTDIQEHCGCIPTFEGAYERLIERLFTSRGYQPPRL